MTKKYPGHLLVANPNNPRDELSKSVILLVTHADKTAIGLQINSPVDDIDLKTVAFNSDIDYPRSDPLYYGGNIGVTKIHVIHSNDWSGMTTVALTDDISVTNDLSILMALSLDDGPKHFRACAGYWLWDNYRLDKQLDPHCREEPHKWEIVPATSDILFGSTKAEQWRYALDQSTKHLISAWF